MALTAYNQIANRGLERIAALSDGVFAVAMTLLVLDIRLPVEVIARVHTDVDLLQALGGLASKLVPYLLSFLTLGIFWNGQQTQMTYIARANRHLAWLYLGFLAAVALMPFTTTLLSEFITLRVALIAYWANIFLLGLLIYASWVYVGRAGLLREDTPPEVFGLVQRRILVAQALYGFGAALCLINTYVSIGFIVLVQLNFAIAPRIPRLSRI
jgi:uncharacterized membrane protein